MTAGDAGEDVSRRLASVGIFSGRRAYPVEDEEADGTDDHPDPEREVEGRIDDHERSFDRGAPTGAVAKGRRHGCRRIGKDQGGGGDAGDREREADQPSDPEGDHQPQRDEVAESRLSRMSLQDADLPATVVQVLAPQPAQRGTAVVPAADGGVADDPPSGIAEPVAELIVLVPDHLLVEWEAQVRLAPAEPHEDRIDLARLRQVVVTRAAYPERAADRDRDRLADRADTDRMDGSADHVGAGGLDRPHRIRDVGRVELGVATDDPDVIPGGDPRPRVPRGGLDPLRIREDRPSRPSGDELLDELPRAIRRAPVVDEDFEMVGRMILRGKGGQAGLDRCGLVAHRHDHGDPGWDGFAHGQDLIARPRSSFTDAIVRGSPVGPLTGASMQRIPPCRT